MLVQNKDSIDAILFNSAVSNWPCRIRNCTKMLSNQRSDDGKVYRPKQCGKDSSLNP